MTLAEHKANRSPHLNRAREKNPPQIEQLILFSTEIHKAYEFAQKAHEGQKRKSGEPYFTHPIEVANIILSWGITDETMIIATLLHDTEEDNDNVTLNVVEEKFGKEVRELVDGVSKFRSENGEHGSNKETLQKVAHHTFIDPRVGMIKLADRLHNSRTLEAMPPDKQISKSRETLNVYAPLARALGMWQVKTELEDTAFMYLDMAQYALTKHEVDKDPRLSPKFISDIHQSLATITSNGDTPSTISDKRNGYWTLYKKRERALIIGESLPVGFAQINDLLSFRIQVNTVEECYKMLGKIHSAFETNFRREEVDHYLEQAQSNGYSAIHTTIDTQAGPVEIAITTNNKEGFNDMGVAHVLSNSPEIDVSGYALKLIFNKKDEVIFISPAANGIDTLYAIDPSNAAMATAIIVDGTKQPLSQVVPNGATVSGIYDRDVEPPYENWIPSTLPETKKLIERQIILREKMLLIKQGKQIVREILVPRGITHLSDVEGLLQYLLFTFQVASEEEIHLMIARNNITEQAMNKLLDEKHITKKTLGLSTIIIKGYNKPGILGSVSNLVTQNGGDIRGVHTNVPKNDSGKLFTMRLVIKDLDNNTQSLLDQLSYEYQEVILY